MMVKGSVLDRTNVIGFQGFGVCGGSFPRWLKFADHCSQLGLGFRVFQIQIRKAQGSIAGFCDHLSRAVFSYILWTSVRYL